MLDKISIIMPVRNGIPFLQECLDSIRNQTYANWELHAVNDHSTDETQQILEQYAELDSRIKPTHNLGKGIIKALITGNNLSIGQYITRMDADDIMPPKKLATLYDLLARQNLSALATGHVKYFSETGVKDGYKSYETWLNQLCVNNNHYQYIYKECAIASPAWMMRRDYFEEIGGFESETYPEDYDLCFRMYEHKVKIIPTNTIVHHWRDHGSRTSRTDENYADNRFLTLKLYYFHKIEVPKHDSFILIGAGKKGKTVAKFLNLQEVPFTWATNNPKKIGIDIYDKTLKNYNEISFDHNHSAIIVSVANKDEQTEIKNRLQNINLNRVYFLC